MVLSDEFGRIYRSSTDSEKEVLKAHFFFLASMDSTGFSFISFSFVCGGMCVAQASWYYILRDDEIGCVYRFVDRLSQRRKAERLI